jgi:hypothetical protein
MNNFLRNITFYLLTVSTAMLTSCTTASSEAADAVCMPPVEKLAYPVGVPKPLDSEPTEVPPLRGWQYQTSLPEPSGQTIAPQLAAEGNEVWVLPVESEAIYKYLVHTNQWKIYDSIDDHHVIPRSIFQASDGTLWGFDQIAPDFKPTIEYPLLSRFDLATDQFEFVRDVDGLLDKILTISVPTDVSEDKSSRLWFFGNLPGGEDVGLFSFDPLTAKAEKHLSLPLGYGYEGPVVAPDGNIWFFNHKENRLVYYSPTTRQTTTYYGLPIFQEREDYRPLFFDREGRLWINNYGWLDFTNPIEPIWHEIIPSPVFVTDRGNFIIHIGGDDQKESGYGEVDPFIISQSSNGWYWFTTSGGTIKLDTTTEEWCLFTTGSSPVVDDGNGHLWIEVYDKLYKYRLKP